MINLNDIPLEVMQEDMGTKLHLIKHVVEDEGTFRLIGTMIGQAYAAGFKRAQQMMEESK